MTSRRASDTVEAVNLALLEALGLKPEDHITAVDIHLSAFGYPTMTVTRELHPGDEPVVKVSKLRLREVTGDGL